MSHQLDNIPMEEDMNVDDDDVPAPGAVDGDIELPHFQVGVETNVTSDGGVTKKVVVAGTGYETPDVGDEVQVHYVGTLLDGTEFDSSRKRGDPFEFELGKGKVIKGWDLGVKTMLKGEKAILTCKPEYAYGKSGSGGTIPPDATLQFEVELLSWKSAKDLTNDGGVIKSVLEEGSGWENPKDRDEVLVTYTARVKGESKPFSESPAEGTEFVLANGFLVDGIKVALKTMKENERVHLKLKPQYAFGEKGDAALGVPLNAELEIELHLLSWKKVEDVTDDGAVVKKIMKPAASGDWKKPNDGATVTLLYVARLPDGTVVDEHGEHSPVTAVIDEGQLLPGLEKAVMKMKKGEKALVTMTADYAYGSESFTGTAGTVPPGSDLSFEVTLVDFQNTKEDWEMNDEEKVAASKVKKDKGNAAYAAGNLEKALKLYEKAVSHVNHDHKTLADNLKAEAKDIKKSCWSNLAMVHLKLKEYKKAISVCDKVLDIDPRHVKALHRRAQAYLANQDFIEAERDLKAALEVEPKNAVVTKTFRELKVQMKEASKKEAALYGKMFKALGKLSSSDADPTPSKTADTSGVMEMLSGDKPAEASTATDAVPTVETAA